MNPENEISVARRGDVTLLSIHGDVTSASEPFLKEAYESVECQQASKILLHFDKDTYVNSGGILVLSDILFEAKRKNQQLVISGLSSHIKKIFQMVGITRLAAVYDTMDEALTYFSACT